jgi:hypothetical protein
VVVCDIIGHIDIEHSLKWPRPDVLTLLLHQVLRFRAPITSSAVDRAPLRDAAAEALRESMDYAMARQTADVVVREEARQVREVARVQTEAVLRAERQRLAGIAKAELEREAEKEKKNAAQKAKAAASKQVSKTHKIVAKRQATVGYQSI